MDKHTPERSDAEQLRQELIDEITADHGAHWAKQYPPGSFGCHELLDRTALIADLVDRHVLSHPACVQNKEWFALAEQALAALLELYQRIGAVHIDDR
ncbi:MAG: hypothetical protein Q7O66_15215 [Dehalococcoidia bacterium]|nr:hypothetical protein [Dehalococcoidia bacterium]